MGDSEIHDFPNASNTAKCSTMNHRVEQSMSVRKGNDSIVIKHPVCTRHCARQIYTVSHRPHFTKKLRL